MKLPRLIGVIHLPPLPGAPRCTLALDAIVDRAVQEAVILEHAGFEAAIVENYGDVPFFPTSVPPVTIAAMSVCVHKVRAAVKMLLGVNVLRNDGRAALAVAACSGASLLRVNVHTGARVTDQGLVESCAHALVRERAALRADHIRILADVDVKHSAALAPRHIADEADETVNRGLADAVLVTGSATGAPPTTDDLQAVRRRVSVPVFAASGVSPSNMAEMAEHANGVVVGSWIRVGGTAGAPLDPDRVRELASSFARHACHCRRDLQDTP